MSYLGQLFALSAVGMGIAQTVTKERLFERLRGRLGRAGASHWVAFVLAPPTGIYGIRVQVRSGLLVAFWFVDQSQGLVRRRNRVIEQVAEGEDGTRVRH